MEIQPTNKKKKEQGKQGKNDSITILSNTICVKLKNLSSILWNNVVFFFKILGKIEKSRGKWKKKKKISQINRII